jgi:uncharacterized membrane protein
MTHELQQFSDRWEYIGISILFLWVIVLFLTVAISFRIRDALKAILGNLGLLIVFMIIINFIVDISWDGVNDLVISEEDEKWYRNNRRTSTSMILISFVYSAFLTFINVSIVTIKNLIPNKKNT